MKGIWTLQNFCKLPFALQ